MRPHTQVFGTGSSSSDCVAVQMHNLQHKFLRLSLEQQTHPHAPPPPNTATRVSLVQAAMFYLNRKGADRYAKIGQLLQLALGGLRDPRAIGELSHALRTNGIDLDTRAAHTGEMLNLNTIAIM